MNYRHAFHAGNFADVHKHVVLARILVHLRNKPAAFRVIDSHAGAGRYDLFADEPTRSGEWREGIARIWDASRGPARAGPELALLAPFLDAVASLNPEGTLRTYPGSPALVQSLLRAQDRLIACEFEPRAATALQATLRSDRRAKVVTIDGWTALKAYVPPKERRGLVLVDPPFEDTEEFARLSNAFAAAHRKWPTGIYLLWYPIKDRSAPDALARRLQGLGVPKVLRSELTLRPPQAGAGLIGSGLVVVNPPFRLEAELRLLLPTLAKMLGPQAGHRLDWLVTER